MIYDRETLVAKLREAGVKYLAPSDAVATEEVSSMDAFLVAVINQTDGRLKLALIPLFIRHPELAQNVSYLVEQLPPDAVLDLQTYYMAAVYLQRHWKSLLRLYLGNTTLLPDLFSQTLGLSPADEYFGKTGLYELADAWKARSSYPFNRLASLNQTMDLFFEQLKIEQRLSQYAPAS
ncbi:MAG: hypothetical protein R3A44_15170 [Caldilineaceae bacterium]